MLHPLPPPPLAFHGAAGPYDELINLIPLLVGGVFLLYLYFTSRRQAGEKKQKRRED